MSPPTNKWAEITLGHLINLEYGAGLLEIARTGEGFPVFGSSGIVGRHEDYLVEAPGIVVGRKGSIGSVFWTDEPFYPIDTTYYVQQKTSDYLRWIYWYLTYLPLEKLDTSTGVPGLNRNDAYRVPIQIPPVPEQHKIAEILDTIDDLITLTDRHIAKLKLAKAGLLHDLLTRGIDKHGELRDPIAHPEQFKETGTAIGRIPKAWEVTKLEDKKKTDYPHIKTGPFGSSLKTEHWVNEGVPVITIGALGEGQLIKSELLFITQGKANSLSAYILKEGDIVFSRVADVGRSAVINKLEDGWIMSSNLMRISLEKISVAPKFAYFNIIDNEKTRQQIRRFVNAGGREVANTAILESLLFAWAPIYEHQKIVNCVAVYDEEIVIKEKRLEKLKLIKNGLMADLLTGRVRVNLDNFEGG